MRLTLAILIAATLGALIGVGRAMLHFGALGGERAVTAVNYPPDETDKYWSVPTDGSQPVARPDEETHHFNHMEVGATLRHTFLIRNDGKFPLVVRKSDSSCVCTVASVGGAAIPPGEAAKVTLEWTTKAGSRPGDLFRQWAEVETNDPKRRFITFTVEGEIVGPVATEQPDFVLGRVARSETRVARMKLYAFRSPEGEKLAATRVDNEANDIVDVLSVTTAPLAAGELAGEGAVDGLWVQLTVKPGLPLGSIRQTIRPSSMPDATITSRGFAQPAKSASGRADGLAAFAVATGAFCPATVGASCACGAARLATAPPANIKHATAILAERRFLACLWKYRPSMKCSSYFARGLFSHAHLHH